MRTVESQLILSLVDRVSGASRAVANGLGTVGRAITDVRGQTVSMGTRIDAAIARNNAALDRARLGLADAAVGYYALSRAIGAPIRAAASFEDAMADVRKVVDFPTPESLREFERGLFDLSQRVPVAVEGLAAIAAAAGQAGIAREDILAFTEAAAQIGTAFDISADLAGEAMANLMTALNLDIEGATRLADAMNHLSNNQASTASAILDVVRRVGAQATQFGFTAEQTAAFGSAMIAAGASSEVAATSFRNMGTALSRGESATTRQREALQALGLDAVDVARRMQEDAAGTVIEVMERIGQLPAEMRAAVATDLFGAEARALGPLLTNLDLLRESLGYVADESEYAGSAMAEFEARNQTFNAGLQRFQNLVTRLSVSIGSALLPGLNGMLEAVTPLVAWIADLADRFPGVTAAVVGTTSAVIGLRIALAGLRYLGLLGRGGVLAALSLGFRTLGPAIAAASSAARVAVTAAWFSGLGTAITGVSTALAAISAPVWGGIAAAVAALGVAGLTLWRRWDRVSSFIRGFAGRILEAFEPVLEWLRPAFEWMAGAFEPITAAWTAARETIGGLFSGLSDLLGGLFEREILTDDQRAGVEGQGAAVADAIIGGITGALERARLAGANLILTITEGASSLWANVREWWSGRPAAAFQAVSENISALLDAGRALVQSLWDGAVARFNEFIAWVRSWPRLIMEAVGSIDLSSAIRLPRFLGGLFEREILTDDQRAGVEAQGAAFADAIIGGITGALERARLAGANLILTITEGASSLWANVRQWWSGRPAAIFQAVSENVSALLDAGRALVQSLWDGAVARFNEFIAWVRSWPRLIMEAVGSIDLSSAIRLPRFLGGGENETEDAPARASGGPVSAGRLYRVNEFGRGTEYFRPSSDGYVSPLGSVSDILSGGASGQMARLEGLLSRAAGRSVSLGGVTINPSLSFPGATAADAEAIAATVMARIEAEIGHVLGGVAADPQMWS